MEQQVIIAPKVIVPISASPKTPAEAAKGFKTVTMEFPSHVHLTVDTNDSVYYPQGTHEVPEHLVSHWYLKAHGARPYNRPLTVAEVSTPRAGKGARKQ